MKLMKGKATGLSQETRIMGASTSGNMIGPYISATTRTHSHNEIHFRIDNQPVHVKLNQRVNVNDGEEVVVAGENKKGVFRGFALKNNETNIVYSLESFKIYFGFIMSTIAVLFGLFMTVVGIAFFAESKAFGIIVLLFALLILLPSLILFNTVIKYFRANRLIWQKE